MSTPTHRPVAPTALRADEGEAFWFLEFLVTIKASSETTDGRVAAIEWFEPRGRGNTPARPSSRRRVVLRHRRRSDLLGGR